MRYLLALFAGFLLLAPAIAHQQKITISTISHNPRTGMIEVVHQVPLHDAEHALRGGQIASPDILYDAESRRAFARYVAEHFSISSGGKAIALTLLGSAVEGGNLIVYQEGPSPDPGTRVMVQSQLLSEIWHAQENRVNIGSGSGLTTLIFVPGDRAKSAILR